MSGPRRSRGPVRIRQSNPITRGMRLMMVAPFDGPFVPVGGASIAPNGDGYARTLSGSGQYMIADNPGISTTSLTYLVVASVSTTAQQTFFALGNTSTTDRVVLYLAGPYLALFCGQGNGAYGQALATIPVPLNKMNTLAGRVSGIGSRDIWQNGAMIATNSTASNPAAATKALVGVDLSAGNPSGFMSGQVRLAFAWDRALSDAELRSAMANPELLVEGLDEIDDDDYASSVQLPDMSIIGTASAALSTSGTLSSAIALAGAGTAGVSALGALSSAIPLAGTSAVRADAAGALSTGIALAGGTALQAATSGSLSAQIQLAGAPVCSTTAAGTLSTGVSLAGAAGAQLAVAGELAGAGATFGGSAAVRAAAAGTLSTSITLSGGAVLQISASGSMGTASAALSGTTGLAAAASGGLSTAIRLQGAAAVSAGVLGSLSSSQQQVDISTISLARIVVFEGSGSRIVPFEGSGSRVTPFDSSGSRITPFEGSGSRTVRFV